MNEATNSHSTQAFQSDLANCWRRLPNKTPFFVLLAAWLALFHFWGSSTFGHSKSPSLFGWMWSCYDSSINTDDAYGGLIPFLVIILFWWKRNELLNLRLRLWLPSVFIIAAGLLLHFVGYMIQQERISIVALFVGIYGLMGLAWGAQWLRKSFFPFFLFIFCVPSSLLLQPVTLPLRILVSTFTEWISHYILGIGVLRMGTELFDPLGAYQYDVAAACSGIRSLVAIFLLATVYGFVTFRSPWKRLFLMALAFPLAILANLLRMLCIIIAAALGGQSAGNYVHEGGPFGIISLLPYIPAILGLFLAGWWLEKQFGTEKKSSA